MRDALRLLPVIVRNWLRTLAHALRVRLLATPRPSGRAQSRSGVPPAPDVGGTPREGLRLTRRRPTGDEVYGRPRLEVRTGPVPSFGYQTYLWYTALQIASRSRPWITCSGVQDFPSLASCLAWAIHFSTLAPSANFPSIFRTSSGVARANWPYDLMPAL